MRSQKLDLKKAYTTWVAKAQRLRGVKGLEQSIGGQFTSYGIIEREMLGFYGLRPEHYLIDVGCGAGRLAIPLSEHHHGDYLGTDIVEDLIQHAKQSVKRDHWRFKVVDQLKIPESDGVADMVCMFSVLRVCLESVSQRATLRRSMMAEAV
jgi:2-polyprenyl-3-methyl-5-hydroxy-6-metoxy-1,4-benzoquinol methylase